MQNSIPCVGIIPDGNRRWANLHDMPRLNAYRRAMTKLAEVIQWFYELADSETVVVYLLSQNNLRRPPPDLDAVLQAEAELANGALLELCYATDSKVTVAGLENVRSLVNPALEHKQKYVDGLIEMQKRTSSFASRHIYLLAGYDPIAEIRQALNPITPHELDISHLSVPVYLDVVFRTSGESRLSNFAPVQSGYAELFFVSKYFPDVTRQDVLDVVGQFHERKRNFGV